MFIVCGEALFDVFATCDTATGMVLDGRIGGSPFNVALGLARLRQPVGFFGGIGTGFAGERLMRALADEGVASNAVARIDAPTTLSLIGLDAQGVPSYAFYGHGAADRLVRPDHLAAIPARANAFHFGSYSMVVQPVGATQRALLWMQPRTHLLKISDEDLELLYPGRTIEDFAESALTAGTTLVIVTRGSKGAVAFHAAGCAAAEPVAVVVIDTVGAGDTFQAALLTWLAEHGALTAAGIAALDLSSIADALRFAARAAAITCGRRGADLPRRFELA